MEFLLELLSKIWGYLPLGLILELQKCGFKQGTLGFYKKCISKSYRAWSGQLQEQMDGLQATNQMVIMGAIVQLTEISKL